MEETQTPLQCPGSRLPQIFNCTIPNSDWVHPWYPCVHIYTFNARVQSNAVLCLNLIFSPFYTYFII